MSSIRPVSSEASIVIARGVSAVAVAVAAMVRRRRRMSAEGRAKRCRQDRARAREAAAAERGWIRQRRDGSIAPSLHCHFDRRCVPPLRPSAAPPVSASHRRRSIRVVVTQSSKGRSGWRTRNGKTRRDARTSERNEADGATDVQRRSAQRGAERQSSGSSVRRQRTEGRTGSESLNLHAKLRCRGCSCSGEGREQPAAASRADRSLCTRAGREGGGCWLRAADRCESLTCHCICQHCPVVWWMCGPW